MGKRFPSSLYLPYLRNELYMLHASESNFHKTYGAFCKNSIYLQQSLHCEVEKPEGDFSPQITKIREQGGEKVSRSLRLNFEELNRGSLTTLLHI